MAFPRLNNLSYWLYVAGTALAFCAVFIDGGAGPGWTLLPAAVVAGRADEPRRGFRDLRRARLGRELDPRLDQHHHDIPQHARAGHDAAQGASVCLVGLRDPRGFLLLSLPVLAGAITMLLTDRNFGTTFLRRGRRRRPGPVPAYLLVLRAPGGLHRDPAGLRRDLPRWWRPSRRSRSSAICRWSYRAGGDRGPRLRGLGRTTCTRWACR